MSERRGLDETLEFRGWLLVAFFAVLIVVVGFGIVLRGDDSDGGEEEVVDTDTVFAEPTDPVAPARASRTSVEALFVSLLGPVDGDISEIMARLGPFPAFESVPDDAEIVLVDQRAVGTTTSLSVALLTSARFDSALDEIEADLEASDVRVRRNVGLPSAFPVLDVVRPAGSNEWVDLRGVRLDDGSSWIGITFVDQAGFGGHDPLWASGLPGAGGLDLENGVRVHRPVVGTPGPPGIFYGETPTSAVQEAGVDLFAVVTVDEKTTGGSSAAFDDAVAEVGQSRSWCDGAEPFPLDLSAVLRDPVGAVEFVEDDRRCQVVMAGSATDSVFTTVLYERRVPLT
ncbi:MAG: hypothetical protein AAF467_24975 [Actinomycetota bacterium]